MCAKGTSFNGNAHFDVGGYEFMDVVVTGTNNETTLGEKIETVGGFRGEGVGGIKTEIVAGAEIGFVGGLKYDWNLGSKYDFSFGYKFGRSPMGTVEAVGDFFHWNNSHTMTVGTSFFVGAGETATIHAGTVNLSGASASLALSLQGANVLFSGNGMIANAVKTVVSHSIEATMSSGSNYLQINPTGIYFNTPLTNINANVLNLGQPPIEDPGIADMFALAEADAEAAEAAAQEMNAVGQAMVEWLEDFMSGEEPFGIPGGP